MAGLMRYLSLALPLLASCLTAPTDGASGASPMGSASAPSVTEQAALLRLQAQQQANAAAAATRPPPAAGAAEATGTAPEVPVDRNRKLETVDVFTDLMYPASQKQLAAYLMKPEEWMIVRVDMPSPTTRWWRFQRVARTDGTSLPDVDPLRRR